MRLRSAPELDITAMLRPRGMGWRARNSTASIASSNELKRMTPALPATASNASALPASEPVCASAAAREVSDAPTFTATTTLPFGARAPRGIEEVRGIGYALDVAEDDAQLRHGGEVVDEIGNPAAELAAAGGEVGGLQSEIVDGAVDDGGHRAALHGDGDRARHRLLQRLVGHGGEIRRAAGDAHAGRADHRDAGARDRFAQQRAALAAVGIAAFAEARGIDGGAARAGGAAVFQNFDGGFGRGEDREMVGRFRQRVEPRDSRACPRYRCGSD